MRVCVSSTHVHLMAYIWGFTDFLTDSNNNNRSTRQLLSKSNLKLFSLGAQQDRRPKTSDSRSSLARAADKNNFIIFCYCAAKLSADRKKSTTTTTGTEAAKKNNNCTKSEALSAAAAGTLSKCVCVRAGSYEYRQKQQ